MRLVHPVVDSARRGEVAKTYSIMFFIELCNIWISNDICSNCS